MGTPGGPIKQALVNAGFSTGDADTLDDAFVAEPVNEFMAGLEEIAQAVTSQTKPRLVPPGAEPWKTIHGHMLTNGLKPEDAYKKALKFWTPFVQMAIEGVVSLRMADLLGSAGQAATKKQKRFKTAEYLSALRSLGYSFRMNDLNDDIEVNGVPISDGVTAEIRTKMRDLGFDFVHVMEDAYTAEAHHQRYHPVRNYLRSLQYDGGQYISELAGHFGDRYGVFESWLRHWMIGAVAKALDCKQNVVLVMDGPQGIGKSLFTQWLGNALPKYFSEATLTLNDKDTYIRLISTWIWEIGEFGQTIRKLDREAFKNFITLNEVTVRAPYGRHDLKKPALASMIGTVNNESGILDDPTGSRRFLITHVTKIDWAYSNLDVHKVWAEAHAAYLAGEPWYLSPQEQKLSAEINEKYEIEDPIEGLVLKYFRVDPANPLTWTSSQEIISMLEVGGLKGTSVSNSRSLAQVMRRLKCERKKQRNSSGQLVSGYSGVSII